jgi:phage terminase large subunit
MAINLNISKKVFNDAYFPYLNDETYTQIFFGGSSSGKSYAIVGQRTVLDMLKGGHNYLVTRNVQLTIRKSVFNEITKAISFFKVNHLFSINKSDLVITCTNGYQILFAGLDDVEKIKSITPSKGVITDIIVEEATETDYAVVKQLYKRLRGLSKVKKRVILLFNPILQQHWIYQEYFGGWDDSKNVYRDDTLLIVKTTYKDNKFLSPEDIYQLENEKDPYFYNVYTLGNWGVIGGVIFKNWKVEDLSSIKHTFSTFNNGLDFGFASDPAAAIRTYYDRKHNRLYILDEIYERGLTNDDLAKSLKPLIGREAIRCDSAEPKSIMELAQRGITAVEAIKGKDSVNYGIQWMQQQEIIIDIRCQNAKNEFSSYKWEEDKHGDQLPKPVDRNNHLIDACRYANELEMVYWREKQAEPAKPKDYDRYDRQREDDGGSWMTG